MSALEILFLILISTLILGFLFLGLVAPYTKWFDNEDDILG